MKKIILIALCGGGLISQASILDLSSATLNLTGLDTSSSTYSTALSVQANTGGDVLVIGTFSTAADAKIGEGSWQLSNGIQTSTQITRTLDNRKDTGIASVAHVFTGVQADSLINLQHSSSAGGTVTTFGGNLIAIPLTVSTGEKLNYGLHQQSSGYQIQSTTFVSTQVKTTVQLDRASDNGIYIAASFNSQSISSSEAGIWQLQYRKVGDTQWIDTGSPITRTMSSTSDKGSVTLYGLEEGLESGTYEVQLAGKTANGGTVETLNGTLAAVALSYANETGGGYFDGFSVTTNSLSPVGGPYDGAQATLSLDSANGGIFASMNFTATADQGANQTAAFDLLATNLLSSLSNQENQRFFSDTSDSGSGASAGYFSSLEAGEHTIFGRYDNISGPVTSSEVTLVGFATESIPEPAVIALIGLFGGGILFLRRWFS